MLMVKLLICGGRSIVLMLRKPVSSRKHYHTHQRQAAAPPTPTNAASSCTDGHCGRSAVFHPLLTGVIVTDRAASAHCASLCEASALRFAVPTLLGADPTVLVLLRVTLAFHSAGVTNGCARFDL